MRTLFLLFAVITLASAGIVGGWRPVRPSDENWPRVLSAADFAVTAINQNSPQTTTKLVKIISAEEQVVAGMNYRMLLQLISNGNLVQHSVTVWDQFGDMSLTEDKVVDGNENQGSKFKLQGLVDKLNDVAIPEGPIPPSARGRPPRGMTGGWSEVNVGVGATADDMERMQATSAFAIDELNARSNSIDKYELIRIVQAYQQVVAGLKYRLLLELKFQGKAVFHTVVVYDRWGDRSLLDDAEVDPNFRFTTNAAVDDSRVQA